MRSEPDTEQLVTRLDVLEQQKNLLEQENRWLKQQLFGRSSEKRESPPPASQEWLFNEAEG